MRAVRAASILFLATMAAACLFAPRLAPASYADQFRDTPDAACSRQHPLGTDDLGRDRFSRVLYGTRVSLILAPAAALLATLLAGVIGGVAGFVGGWLESLVMAAADLVLAMPWLFLLITVRALLPLNVPPLASVSITFALLGFLGWAGAARVLCADARTLSNSEMVLLARASGSGGARLLWRHVLPNLNPALRAQFWISIPVFILAEANLGILGLGVAEPLPSWGSLLKELEGYSALNSQPAQFVPLILLVLTIGAFQLALERGELWA
ncbi:MAG TPA: ABC transporter permease [Terracidiphilus sp.]|nr:ABC transporter permease [Terracidiphilus sp.]